MTQESGDSVHVIAEIANTHEGDVERAKRIIAAVPEGADAIKVQAYTAEELMVPGHPNYDSLGRKMFSRAEWEIVIQAAAEANFEVYADVFGTESAALMADLGVDGFKIHSSDVSNRSLLEQVANYGKPVYIAAGGVSSTELDRAMNILTANGCEPEGLIYGFQNYPTKASDTHLRKITALRSVFDQPIGFAPHADGASDIATELPAWSVAAGADIVEVHVTVGREAEPTDYESSLTSEDFQRAIESIRKMEPVLGAESKEPNAGEQQYRAQHKKYVTASEPLEAGERLTADALALKRVPDPPETALSDIEAAIGRVTTTELARHDPVTEDDLDPNVVAVLACRARSRRLYGKPMQIVDCKPILQHLIDRLEKVDGINEIALAIADEPAKQVFVEYAKSNGYPYVVGSEEDVLARLISGARETNAETLVRVTTENPFVHWENIDDLIETHHKNDNDLTTVESFPSGTYVEIISREALVESHERGEDRHQSELCTLYINENEDEFSIQRLDPPSTFERPDIRLTVDYPSDLIVARQICDGLDERDEPLSLEEIIEFLDKNPDLRDFNSGNPNETRLYD